MAKNLSGDLQVASANRLTDGVVVYLDDAGQCTPWQWLRGPTAGFLRRVGRCDPERALRASLWLLIADCDHEAQRRLSQLGRQFHTRQNA